MSEGRKTLALVDDHPIVIEGLKSVLSKWNGQYDLICFSNGLSILNYLHDNHIDIVLLDISLPDINGLEVCKKIKTESPRTKVVGLSNQAEYSVISMMLENGASGFLLKEVPSHEIMEGLDQVVKGETALSAEVKNILASQSKQTQSLPSLTKREKQLIQLLAKGKTTSKIATELSLRIYGGHLP